MTRGRVVALVLATLIAAFFGLRRWNTLPALDGRTVSAAVDGSDTRLGRAIAPLIAAHPDVSGVYPLRDARDAFAARYLLASAAERTLDVQYYIWRLDMSGTLLFKALLDAAQRGVRVRLLLDDNNTAGLDATLSALDAHPSIEVRLFNPFVIRRPRAIGYIVDFARANRRMHNKSFTADNQATIIGGRNVGDEYFAATDGVLFTDLDVIAAGPVAGDVSRDFDRYWSSGSSYPADRLLPPAGDAALARLTAAASRVADDPEAVAYMTALRNSTFVRELVGGTLPLEWTATRMISDDPAKALDRAPPEGLILAKIHSAFGSPARSVDLVSPYFVPGSGGAEMFTRWRKRRVSVRVLTNSLEATDVAAVHAGYAKRRKALLRDGVVLYELRRRPGATPDRGGSASGSSSSSLHAKTFAVDGAQLFIGSFNFDPRSAELNTEMGFVIDSTRMAREIATVFSTRVPINAYEVRLSESGQLFWMELRNGEVIRHDTEPGTTFWQRAGVAILSLLPIEWLL